MTIELTTVADVRLTWALPTLKDAQKRFAKYPTAANWRDCTRAMVTYQQLCYCKPWQIPKLMFDLESNPVGQWQDVICRNVLGLTCAEALALS